MAKGKMTNTIFDKSLQRKPNIEQHEAH